MDSSAHISTHVDGCGRGFVSLAEALPNNAHFAEQIRPETVRDEFDRFRIWAGNIAAHRKGRRSLEYRLRDAAHLRTEALNLLVAIQGFLQDSLAIVNGERTPWDEFSDSDTDSESDVEVSSIARDHGLQGNTELKQIFANIKNAVTCLFRLSMAIRDPAPNNQSRSTITVDKSFHEKHDIDHVKAKFSINPSFLAKRLGRAISGRRQYLNYREQHHQKLMKDVEKIGFEQPKTEHTINSTEVSKGTATDHDVLDDEALSQTSYAPSENATIRVPPLPKEARKKEHFECPLCFMIVSIHSTAAWKQHVYRDLHPYSCTFENCTTADRLYDSRSAWFKHELEAHRTSWQCVDECGAIFQSERSFTVHVGTHHPDLADSELLAALKKTSSKSANLSDYAQCPLCAERMTLHALQKHLGRHQEQLALFALPPNLDATEDDAPDESGPPADEGKWQDEELSDISDSAEFDELSAPVIDLPNQERESKEAHELDMNSRILYTREDSPKLQERIDAKKAASQQHSNEWGDDSGTEPVDQFPLAAAPNSQPSTWASDNDSLPASGGMFQESDANSQASTTTSYEPIEGPIPIYPRSHQAHVEDVLEASSEEEFIVARSAINPTSMESTGGCKTCLKRKQGCDRSQPTCDACLRDGVDCEGYNDQVHPPYAVPVPPAYTLAPYSRGPDIIRGMSPGNQKQMQQAALQRANLQIQSHGVPAGQNPHTYRQSLASRFYQMHQQQQQQQQQQHSTRPPSSQYQNAPSVFSPGSYNSSSRPPSARHASQHENPFAQPPTRTSHTSQDGNPFALPPTRTSHTSQDGNPFALPPTRNVHPTYHQHENPFAAQPSVFHSPPETTRDPWDNRDLRDALPRANQHHTLQRRGEEVINRATDDRPRSHGRAQQATRNLGAAQGFEDDYESSSEEEELRMGFGKSRRY